MSATHTNFILIFLKLCPCFLHGLKVCMWFGSLHLFLSLFPLCHFLTSDSMKVYRQWVPCERNSSYNFIPILLKPCTRFFHGLEMCMWFEYNPCINFYHFFHFVNFCHFLTSDSVKGYRQWVPCEHNSSYNFILILLKPCTCFFHGLEMCMWFEYNPCINFCHFFHFVNLSFSDLRFYESV